MHVTPTQIPDVLLIEPRVFGDERGSFMETWNERSFSAAVPSAGRFVQDNQSTSKQGVLRGLHYQIQQPQGKLVRCTRGAVYDVAVDLRRSSPSFGQWVGAELSATNRRMLWVPPGFAHGFLTTSTTADFLYKCTEFYAPEHERTLAFDDPSVGIEWPTLSTGGFILSDKDKRGARLDACETFA